MTPHKHLHVGDPLQGCQRFVAQVVRWMEIEDRNTYNISLVHDHFFAAVKC